MSMKYLNKERTRRINKKYIQVKIDNKWIFEHRYKCERFIGRILKKSEVVHHIIPEQKFNNSINNLMIFQTQSEHLKFHIYIQKFGWNQRTRRIIANRWKNYKT